MSLLARRYATALLLAARASGEIERIERELAARKVELQPRVLPELLGGVRLRLGNLLFDGSVKTALDQLEQRLHQVPV